MAVQKENKEIEIQGKKPLELTVLKVNNEKFVQNYVRSGVATTAYCDAYGISKDNLSGYMGAAASANALLKNPKIQKRITELLDLNGFNSQGVDLVLNHLVHRYDNPRVQMAAIREANKIWKRTESTKTTITGNTFNLSSLLDKANIIEVKPE